MTGTKRDLHADLALCEAATPGPWQSHTNRHPELSGKPWGTIKACNGTQVGTWSGSRNANYSADNRYITEAREGWPYAIRRAIAAESRLKEVEAELAVWKIRALEMEDLAEYLRDENKRLREAISDGEKEDE